MEDLGNELGIVGIKRRKLDNGANHYPEADTLTTACILTREPAEGRGKHERDENVSYGCSHILVVTCWYKAHDK